MGRIHYPVIPFFATIRSTEGDALFRIWPSVVTSNIAGPQDRMTYLVSIDPDPVRTEETGSMSAVIVSQTDCSFTLFYIDPTPEGATLPKQVMMDFTRVREHPGVYRVMKSDGTGHDLDEPSSEIMEFVFSQIRVKHGGVPENG